MQEIMGQSASAEDAANYGHLSPEKEARRNEIFEQNRRAFARREMDAGARQMEMAGSRLEVTLILDAHRLGYTAITTF